MALCRVDHMTPPLPTSVLFSARNSGRYTAVAILDFMKAFDTADHAVLLAKLQLLGFDIAACDWFKSYLSNRTQSVHYAGQTSQPLPVSSGVLEGSVISPVMFLIYINDLLTSLPNNCVAYADDVTLVAYGDSEAEAVTSLQGLVDIISTWSANNYLRLSTTKSVWIVISPELKKSSQPVDINSRTNQRIGLNLFSVPLQKVSSLHLLGVLISDNLSWNQHVSSVCIKINSMLGAIRRAGSVANANTRHRMFQTYVMPKFQYCLAICGNCSKTASLKLGHILERAVCIITGTGSAVLNKDTYTAYGILPFASLLLERDVCLLHKLLHSRANVPSTNSFSITRLSGCATRGFESNKLKEVKVKRKANRLCFICAATKHWNTLPITITPLFYPKNILDLVF